MGRTVRLVSAALVFAAMVLATVGCVPLDRLQIREDPDVGSGAALLKAHDPEGAARMFDRAIAKRRHDASVYLLVVDRCRTMGFFDMAVRYADRGLSSLSNASSEDRAQLYGMAGDAYLRMRDWSNAARENQEALKLQPDDPTFLNNLGYTFAEMPAGSVDMQKALDLTTRAVRLARESQRFSDVQVGTFVDSLGWVFYRMGRYDEAIANLQLAAGMAPGQAEVHLHLARAFEAKGRLRDALVQLKRANQSDPANEQIAEALQEMKARVTALPAETDASSAAVAPPQASGTSLAPSSSIAPAR